MFVRIPQLLNDENLKLVDTIIETGNFVDGAATTGAPTKAVKQNLQLELMKHPKREDLVRMFTQVFNENPIVRSATLPKRMTLPLISKYLPGMAYGWHVDNAMMASVGGPLRSDIACTIFLNNRQDYEGGELIVRGISGDIKVKLDRGDAFLYPATSRHQVTEISSGERKAVVFWIQSMIADQSKREILYDLELAYDRVSRENPDSEAKQMIQKTQANLVRRWAEI